MKLLVSLLLVPYAAAATTSGAAAADGGGGPASVRLRGSQRSHPAFSIARAGRPQRRIRAVNGSEFALQCALFLLSPERLEDGIISQDEFTAFLDHRCISEGRCANGDEQLEFERLSLDLQLGFVIGVCPIADLATRIGCIKSLEESWLDSGVFGFQVNAEENLSELVQEMCSGAYSDAVDASLIGTIGKLLS